MLLILASFAIQLVVLTVFSAVAMVSSFEADDDTDDVIGVGDRNKTNKRLSDCLIE